MSFTPRESIIKITTGVEEIQAFVSNFNVRSANEYYEYKILDQKKKERIKISESYKITFDNPLFDKNFDTMQLNDTTFTLIEILEDEDTDETITYTYGNCTIDEIDRSEDKTIIQKISITAGTKE